MRYLRPLIHWKNVEHVPLYRCNDRVNGMVDIPASYLSVPLAPASPNPVSSLVQEDSDWPKP